MKVKFLTIAIATVWLVNGLFCKVLGWVPRHELIVSRILDVEDARSITLLIGVSEILMAVWILSGFKSRLNSTLQIAVIGIMNILEFLLAPDLLLWGQYNALFASLFIALIYYKEFKLKNLTLKII